MTHKSQHQLDVPQLVLEAIERCQDHLSPTPLEYSMYLSKKIGGEVWLKLDSMQRTSSFKFRGALNTLLQLSEVEKKKGVITHSSGNHAQALALAAKIVGIKAIIVMPEIYGIQLTGGSKGTLEGSNPTDHFTAKLSGGSSLKSKINTEVAELELWFS